MRDQFPVESGWWAWGISALTTNVLRKENDGLSLEESLDENKKRSVLAECRSELARNWVKKWRRGQSVMSRQEGMETFTSKARVSYGVWRYERTNGLRVWGRVGNKRAKMFYVTQLYHSHPRPWKNEDVKKQRKK